MGQLRPPQAFVSAARLRQGPGHRYSATWNSSARAARFIDTSQVLVTDENRIRRNGCAIKDILGPQSEIPEVTITWLKNFEFSHPKQ